MLCDEKLRLILAILIKSNAWGEGILTSAFPMLVEELCNLSAMTQV